MSAATAAPIGGSEAAAAVGLDPWHSPVRLWAEKTGRLERSEDTEAAAWGRTLEPIIKRELVERTGYTIEDGARELRDERRPYMIGHPDGYVTVGGTLGLLEVKTAGLRQERAWADEQMPAGYLLQCAHYLALTDLPFVLVACLLGGQRLELRTVERDDSLLALLDAGEREFWRSIEADEPPPPDGAEATSEALRALFPSARADSTIHLDASARALLSDYRALHEASEATAAQLERVKQRLMLAMGDAELALLDGEPVCRFQNVTSRRLDTKRLQREAPHVAETYTSESSYRRFQVVA